MKRGLSFPRLLQRSLLYRGARSLSTLLALTVSAAVATALLTLYADLDNKLHHEFRSFGANITLHAGTPEAEGNASSLAPLPADAISRAQAAAGRESIIAPFGFAVAATDRGTPVVVAGVDFNRARQLNQWWKVDAWPQAPNQALLGERAANFITDEHAVQLSFAGRQAAFQGVGRLHTGDEEDDRIYIPMAAYTSWTGLGPTVLEVQVPGGADAVDAALSRLRIAFPGARVDPVRQLVAGESRIIDRTHALMLGAVLLIALTVAVSVLATLSASVLERRRDFALMKALGSSQGHLFWLFLAEALLLAIAGVVFGWLLGSAIAWMISEVNFNTATLPRLSVLPLTLLLNLLIALVAAVAPARMLRGLEPAALLKGE